MKENILKITVVKDKSEQIWYNILTKKIKSVEIGLHGDLSIEKQLELSLALKKPKRPVKKSTTLCMY